MFRIGQKVVCVNADSSIPGNIGFGWHPWYEALVEGQVYTVRRYYMYCDRPAVWLEEIERSEHSRNHWGPDVGYAACRFRPVIERKTDISVFTDMLKQTENAAS